MNPIYKLDGIFAAVEDKTVGLLSANVWLLIGRIIFGFPLLMNGVGQMMQPAILESQMQLAGLDMAWKWPAILASLLGGLAILIGWRVRLASVLLIVYVVAATLLVHDAHSRLAAGEDVFEVPGTTIEVTDMRTGETSVEPLRLPQYARDMCEWHINEFKKIQGEVVTEEFILGCSVYRLPFDESVTMRQFTMFVPALIFLMALGGGRFSLESWLKKKREA